MAKLELWLDGYSDIFSDFDSRHYGKRRVSEDFIHELKLSFLHKTDAITNIILQLPVAKRDISIESVIAESLSVYFRKQEQLHKNVFRKKKRGAWLLILSGIVIMTIGAVVSLQVKNVTLSQVLRILIEPAGWFMLWSGMDTFVYGLNKLKRDKIFFSELAAVKWQFTAIEEAKVQG